MAVDSWHVHHSGEHFGENLGTLAVDICKMLLSTRTTIRWLLLRLPPCEYVAKSQPLRSTHHKDVQQISKHTANKKKTMMSITVWKAVSIAMVSLVARVVNSFDLWHLLPLEHAWQASASKPDITGELVVLYLLVLEVLCTPGASESTIFPTSFFQRKSWAWTMVAWLNARSKQVKR